MKNKYRIKPTIHIGSPDAETDEILFEAFIENEVLQAILDSTNQKSILLGRTGSGKSAIIRYIEENYKDTVRIDPEALSLRFLSNSTILNYFRNLGINLNLFFKVLWKHVFIVELIKLYFKDDFNKEIKNRWFHHVREKFVKKFNRKDPKKEQAINYLDKWTDKFWEDTEYQIRELESNIRKSFSATLGLKTDVFNTAADIEDEVNSRSIADVRHKAESIIHDSQSKELIEVFNMMKDDLFNSHQRNFFIVIDDLDKEWIETSFRYDLIGAMVEVIKEFKQFKGVKIVISLRENLSDLLKLGIKHEGGQREKFKPLYANIKWDKHDLKKLVDRRLKYVTEQHLDIKNAFYSTRRTKETGMDYVLNRTYMRPRDVISFVNHAFENSKSKLYFTKDIIHKAEIPYSIDRYEAIEDEWRENYGEIRLICNFLNGFNSSFKLKSLHEDYFEDIYLEDDIEAQFKGPLLKAVRDWKESKINNVVFFKRIVFLLYHVGIIGVKKGPTFKTVFYYDDMPIKKEDISHNNTYFVHPSLYSYFKINTLDQLPEDAI